MGGKEILLSSKVEVRHLIGDDSSKERRKSPSFLVLNAKQGWTVILPGGVSLSEVLIAGLPPLILTK
eukprot:scaffold174647_cov14-Tisochrysis_lutea.AAC.1